MKQLRTVLSTLGGIFLAALLIAALAPKAARGVAAALVLVANTPANPVPVTDVGERQPFQTNCSSSQPGFLVVQCSVTVPAGKRLVLQIVSAQAIVDSGATVKDAFVEFANGPNSAALLFDLAQTQFGVRGGTSVFVRAQPVTAYVDPGSNLICGVEEAGIVPFNVNSINCNFVGYLVN